MDKGDEAHSERQPEIGTVPGQATFKDDADADADDDDKLAEKQHEMKDKRREVEKETDLSSGCQRTIANCSDCVCVDEGVPVFVSL